MVFPTYPPPPCSTTRARKQSGPPTHSGSFSFLFPFVVFLLNVKDFCLPQHCAPPESQERLLFALVSFAVRVSGWAMPGKPCSPRCSTCAGTSAPASFLLPLPPTSAWKGQPRDLLSSSHGGLPAMAAPYGDGLKPLVSMAEASCGTPCSFSTPCLNSDSPRRK